MQRIPEPELMDDEAQARAYDEADFAEPHDMFVDLFRQTWPQLDVTATVLDLGCGPADISCRFARAYPQCRVDGIDGAAAMLARGRQRIEREGLTARIALHQCHLPGQSPPRSDYAVLISNSLLHHLAEPLVLWRTIRQCAAAKAKVFIMDLMRPDDAATAAAMVEQYAGNEAPLLRHDFYHSLLAAYTVDEVRDQLDACGLSALEVRAVSDRHLTVSGALHLRTED